MTTLRLLIDLLCIVPRIAWAWVKTKMPRRKAYYNCCRDCGWRLSWDTASLICPPCQEQRRQATAKPPLTKLFCCDVDLEYRNTEYRSGYSADGSSTVIKRYRCPACSRIWLYITDRHKDSGSEADWYPQQTEADGGLLPALYDERMRTKVYH